MKKGRLSIEKELIINKNGSVLYFFNQLKHPINQFKYKYCKKMNLSKLYILYQLLISKLNKNKKFYFRFSKDLCCTFNL